MVAFRQGLPFHNIVIVPRVLSLGDVLLAVCVAYILTRLIGLFLPSRDGAPSALPDLTALPEAAKTIIERCYALFPIETVQFRGETFTRGMMVKVTTRAKKTFEGRFLGLNDENVICVLTARKIAADLLENVEEIVAVDGVSS